MYTQVYNLWKSKVISCALLGYYAASSGNFLLMFQDNLLGPILRDRQVVRTCRKEITTTHQVITQKRTVLK